MFRLGPFEDGFPIWKLGSSESLIGASVLIVTEEEKNQHVRQDLYIVVYYFLFIGFTNCFLWFGKRNIILFPYLLIWK
jgi:hypothetical protein